MAKLVALEFDENRIRGLVARTSATGLNVSEAFDLEAENALNVGNAELKDELSKALGNRLGKCDALVCYGRGQSELRVIHVPVVPDNELPDIVRFQALRQFVNSTEDAPVDFLPLAESNEEKKVLAATIPAQAVDNIRTGLQACNLSVKEIKLRATCTTALVQSVDPGRKNCIIIDPALNTLNLDVVSYGKLCLTRTIRSTGDNNTSQIVAEIRRTIAAAKNQVPEFETSEVVVFGREQDFAGLRDALRDELEFDLTIIQPFDHIKGPNEPPENAGHFASLVGLLISHCSPATETIDFLNPRQNVSEDSNSRVKILAAVAVGILVIGLAGLAYMMLAQKSAEIARIRQEIKVKEKSDLVSQEIIADVDKIMKFEKEQAVWLRELALVSQRFMDPDHVILNHATLAINPGKPDAIKIDANGFLQSGQLSETLAGKIREIEGYDATLEDVVLLTEKEKTQDIYSHKFKIKIVRDPGLPEPDVPQEELDRYMKPRLEVAKKELETARKLKEQMQAESDSEKDSIPDSAAGGSVDDPGDSTDASTTDERSENEPNEENKQDKELAQ